MLSSSPEIFQNKYKSSHNEKKSAAERYNI